MDSITLRGIQAQGTHGVLDFEHTQAQAFRVDAQLFLDLSRPGSTDDLADTVDYGQIASRIVSVIQGPHCDLIEALASRVAEAVLQTSAVRSVIVTVHKPQAPIKVPFDDVAVTIERSRLPQSAQAEACVSGPGSVTGSWDEADSAAGLDESSARCHDQAGSEDRPPVPHRAVIAMGGNIGDPVAAMRSAVVAMDGIVGNQVMGISPLYRTTPWGMAEGTPDFLNAVVELSTTLEPLQLLKSLQMIEAAHGRSRAVHWGSRPLDLDIIDFDGLQSSDPVLTLPHPRAWQRAFVLAPLIDLEPDGRLPGPHGGRLTDLLAACPDRDAVKRVSDVWILSGQAFPDPAGADPAPPAQDIAQEE